MLSRGARAATVRATSLIARSGFGYLPSVAPAAARSAIATKSRSSAVAPASVLSQSRVCFSAAAAPAVPRIPEEEYARAELEREFGLPSGSGGSGGMADGDEGLTDLMERDAPAHLRNVKMDGSTRRFYDEVSITPEGAGTYALRLGGHVVMTPDDRPLILPNKHYALLVALEFENQTTFVYPHTMPLTYYAVAVHDRAARDRDAMIESVMGILKFDATLYRDDNEDSPGLVRLQEKHWDPVLEWLEEHHGIALPTTYSMNAMQQPAASVAKFAAIVDAMDPWELLAMDELTSIGKSAVIALAFLQREIDVDRAFRAMRLEETFQLNLSGRVEGVYGTYIPEEHTRLRLAAIRTVMNLRQFKL